jgi:outer membrane protein TolC
VQRSVRNAYLDLYFQLQSIRILTEHERLFVQLFDITQKHYAVGRDNQHDVLRAQLELSLLQDKLVELDGMKHVAVAELAKWISYEKASQSFPDEQPELPGIPPLIAITEALFQHPLILAQDRMIEAKRQQVEIAKEQYKPGWMLDVTYGGRTGSNFDGSKRADFFSAMVLVDIPLFTGKRQDKRVAASQQRHIAAKFTRTDRLRELRRVTDRKYARWQQLRERYELYESRTIMEAAQNTAATLKAYQSDVTDFTTLMRARLTELSTQLAMVRLQVEQSKVQADLLYFAGDRS